jgi:hypothetical protein
MESESNLPRFEEVYPRSEFAPIVSVSLSLAAWIKRISASKPWKLHRDDANRTPELG